MAKLDTTSIEKELLTFLDGVDLKIRSNKDLEEKMFYSSFIKHGDIDVFRQHGGQSINEYIVITVTNENDKKLLLLTAQDICSKNIQDIEINGEKYIKCNVPVLFKI